VDARTDAERMRHALQELKPTEREAVVLHVVGNLTAAEVAEACGTNDATARARIGRGLGRLRGETA
jgi:RNA polymerase sigma-70 factor (ECF subfamily)